MFDYDRLKEAFVQNNDWVKRLRRSTDLEDIEKAIRERIEFPNATGPFIYEAKGELPLDIIPALIETEPDLREKIENATGLLLYKMKRGEIGLSQEILRGVFILIRTSKFIGCRLLLQNWIKDNIATLAFNDKDLTFYERQPLERKRAAFKEALQALAYVQEKDEELERWWLNLWREGLEYWRFASFIGLRRQNPEAAVKELPLLLDRKVMGTSILLVSFWRDEVSKKAFVEAIRNGVNANEKWAGLAMNGAMEKMIFPAEKDDFMASLRGENKGIRVIGNTTSEKPVNADI